MERTQPIDSQTNETSGNDLRQILLQSPNIVLLLKGPNLVIDFVNKPLLQSWNKGWDIIGKPLMDILPELEGQSFPQKLQEVYQTGQPYYGKEEKATLVHNNEVTDVFYNYVYQPLFENGHVSGVWVMATDITEQVTIRKLVEKSEARFRALATTTANAIYRMSPDWREMYTLTGKDFLSDTEEPIRDWLQKYILPDEQPRVLEAIQKAVATKGVFELEHQVLQADGTWGWTFSRAIPILNADGDIVEWFGTASDINARKKAEAALEKARQESESRKRLYETVTSSTPDLIYVFDLDYRFIYANEALLTMWGMNWEQAIGKGLLEIGYEPWHAEMHEREIDQVVATRETIRGVVSFPHATLGKRMYDYIFAPVLNEKGEVEAVAGTTRDITELKKAEETLKQSGEHFEALVAERTRALHRSNEDLQQFAHVASHDLKEPVRKIRTFSDRLKNEFGAVLPEKAVTYIHKIEKAGERMYSMIEGVLSYSSLNVLETAFEQVALEEIIENIGFDLEVVIQQKQARIIYNNLPRITGAPILLYQLFYNLINNSLKFSVANRPPIIQIEASATTRENQSFIKITISDNGIGFRAQDAQRIFQSFSRLNSREQYEGTGLGLALCKNIAERHNGHISAEGRENEGAVFTLLLPALGN